MKRIISSTLVFAAFLSASPLHAHDLRAHSSARSALGALVQFQVVPERHGNASMADTIGTWAAIAMTTEQGYEPLGTYPGARFAIRPGGQMTFSLGCNTYSAQIVAGRYGHLQVQNVSATRRYCGGALGRAENRLGNAVASTVRIMRLGDRLQFRNASNTIVLELVDLTYQPFEFFRP